MPRGPGSLPLPRAARLSSGDAAHHVMVRGIERRIVFVDSHDRADLLERLERVFGDSGARCYAWALMPNHFHLVLRPGAAPLSRLMARIGTGYARRFNERHGRVGHLFQNRFRSRLVDGDADLAGLVRYVHLNPLAGGVVPTLEALETHRWCGHGALLGRRASRSFHSVEETLRLFADGPPAARAALRAWMREGWERGLAPEGHDPDAPARADVARRTQAADGRWERLVGAVARSFGASSDALCGGGRARAVARPRALLAHLAVQRLGLGVCEVAARLRVSPAAVSRAVLRGAAVAAPSAVLLALEERARRPGAVPDDQVKQVNQRPPS